MTSCLGKIFIQSIVRVCRERLSVCLYASFPIDSAGRMWDLGVGS